jgi:hypothetical protein
MADELNWSGAFYESLAGSIGRVTRGGPVGMAAGVIGEFSAAMQGMNIPWQGPRTAASLAAAVGGGFVLLNAGRGVVEAVNAAGQGDYGSALANAAIGVGWYAAGRFALGTLAGNLPVESGALAAYEKAAQARLAAEAKSGNRRVKGQQMAQAAADSAKVASTNTVNPTTAQAAAEDAAAMAAEVAATPAATYAMGQGQLAFDFGPAYRRAAQPTAAAEPIKVVGPKQLGLDFESSQPQQLEMQLQWPRQIRQYTLDLGPPTPIEVRQRRSRLEPIPKSTYVGPPAPKPTVAPTPPPVIPPPIVNARAATPPPVAPPPVVTRRGPGRARGGVRGMARRFSVLSRRAARRAARGWKSIERWVTSFAAASMLGGIRF